MNYNATSGVRHRKCRWSQWNKLWWTDDLVLSLLIDIRSVWYIVTLNVAWINYECVICCINFFIRLYWKYVTISVTGRRFCRVLFCRLSDPYAYCACINILCRDSYFVLDRNFTLHYNCVLSSLYYYES